MQRGLRFNIPNPDSLTTRSFDTLIHQFLCVLKCVEERPFIRLFGRNELVDIAVRSFQHFKAILSVIRREKKR